MNRPVAHPRAARGMTIVELLIGLALGLFVVAGASTLLAGQLHAQRALAADTRLTQDLRNAADLIARDLRRAGYWDDAASGIWSAGAAPTSNPHGMLAPATAASDALRYSYSGDGAGDATASADADGRAGFRLHQHAIEARLGGRWQALTDPQALVVTAFELVPAVAEIDLAALCPRPCGTAGAAAGTCPPRQQVRSVAVRIAGHAAGDERVVRHADMQVRLRNDAVVGACSA